MKINSSYKGQIVQFVYNGGQTPGLLRTVLIKEGDPTLVRGYDFLREEWRNFNSYNITNAKVLSADAYRVVYLNILPSTITKETVIEGFLKDGYLAHQEGELIYAVKKDVIEPPEPTVEFENSILRVSGPGGSLHVHCHPLKRDIIIVCEDGKECRYATPDDLLNELKRILCQ